MVNETEAKPKSNTLMLGVFVVVLVAAYLLYTNLESQNNTSISTNYTGEVQDIYIKALSSGSYDPQQITVKKGIPVRLHFTADANAGCGRQMVLYGLNVKVKSINGQEDIVTFTPQTAGTFEYNCGMRMWKPGKLVVQ